MESVDFCVFSGVGDQNRQEYVYLRNGKDMGGKLGDYDIIS